MGTSVTILYTITLISMATKVAVSQFGYGYRSWFGWNPHISAINPLSDECFPDGTSNCRRMTDCCSNNCEIDMNPHETVCKPGTCGCPQPPWGPINDKCWRYGRDCRYNEECCSGYCRDMTEPTRHGGRAPVCWMPPCKLCENTY
ncbi:unnamed protein product [Allacma fusca]|uniref:Uncharacterized protein n=1 Tax=Allacma fusca TaxID=39272 RepID=A0A8J2PW38_9HEXA|nr:unnamed protein product [Allacma fusca]